MAKLLQEMTNEELWALFPIILSGHDPLWRESYLREEALLRQAAGERNIFKISHFGSTAVPGLIAKPTIDILLEIKPEAALAELTENLEAAGYIHSPQPENPAPHMMFLKGYTTEGFKGQAFHVHVRYEGDWDELHFRDYLLAHPKTAGEYGELKLRLQKRFEHNRDAYTAAKTEFVKRVTRLAREEAE